MTPHKPDTAVLPSEHKWRVDGTDIRTESGLWVADCFCGDLTTQEAEAFAQHIVTACNHFEAMRTALDNLLRCNGSIAQCDDWPTWEKAVDEARAALRAVEGKEGR